MHSYPHQNPKANSEFHKNSRKRVLCEIEENEPIFCKKLRIEEINYDLQKEEESQVKYHSYSAMNQYDVEMDQNDASIDIDEPKCIEKKTFDSSLLYSEEKEIQLVFPLKTKILSPTEDMIEDLFRQERKRLIDSQTKALVVYDPTSMMNIIQSKLNILKNQSDSEKVNHHQFENSINENELNSNEMEVSEILDLNNFSNDVKFDQCNYNEYHFDVSQLYYSPQAPQAELYPSCNDSNNLNILRPALQFPYCADFYHDSDL